MTRAAAFIELFAAPARHRPSRIAAAEKGRAVWRTQPPLETVTIDVSGRIDHAYALVTAIGANSSKGIPSIDRIEMPPYAQFHDTPRQRPRRDIMGPCCMSWSTGHRRCIAATAVAARSSVADLIGRTTRSSEFGGSPDSAIRRRPQGSEKGAGEVSRHGEHLAEQSELKRRVGEALIREADNLACQSWNEKMCSDGGPIDPSPTIEQAINGGFPWLEIECSRCGTKRDVDLCALRRPRTTCSPAASFVRSAKPQASDHPQPCIKSHLASATAASKWERISFLCRTSL
jgi:hypothetical protein